MERRLARIAFLGLGNMGSGMANRLLACGHELNVYNRTRSRAEAFASRGAVVFDSPRQACEGVAAVFSMLADDAASRAVWLGADGVLAANLGAHCFAVECSTLSHPWVLELSALCRVAGLRYLDSPVTGLPDVAARGELTLLVGSSKPDLDASRPLLNALSTRIVSLGAVGAGTAYKLIINLMGAVQIAAAAEGMAMAERAGLDPATVADVISVSQAASPQVVRNVRRFVANEHDRDVVFSGALRLKDVEYGMLFARSLGIDAPFGAVAQELYRRLCALGFGKVNESKIIEVSRGVMPGSEE